MPRKFVKPAQQPDAVTVHITFSGADADRFRQFMVEAGYTNPNVALRALAASALDEYPKWGFLTAERRADYWEFRVRVREEWAKKVRELQQELEDEIALMRVNYGNQT